MGRFLIGANLAYYFSMWRGPEYLHVHDLDASMPDLVLWQYAQERSVTIVTKDADFTDLILLQDPPPRVIHIKLGNMKLKVFYDTLHPIWKDMIFASENAKLVQVFKNRIVSVN
jgi:predicted nuclease of predicted toxin-antitoxin system